MTAVTQPDRRDVPVVGDLDAALALIAARAERRDADRDRRVPADALALLGDVGALSFNASAGERRPPAAAELSLVRRVAGADGSVGRIFDGHLNAVERLAVQAPSGLRDHELAEVRCGRMLAGVWGGDPVGGEGPPATVVAEAGREVLRGVKTFCSGAGGLQRAAVLARDGVTAGATALVWIDVADASRVEVDSSWYQASGLVASASHRVMFRDAPVIARIGGPGAITAQPWFGRDALRTAASWAGMADTAVAGTLTALAQRPATGDLEALAVGRILTAQHTINAWLQAAATAMDLAGAELPAVALHGRAAIALACRQLLDEAARACGSRPFAHGSDLDRARRDLELFLLQHRLDPMLARAGAAALGQRR